MQIWKCHIVSIPLFKFWRHNMCQIVTLYFPGCFWLEVVKLLQHSYRSVTIGVYVSTFWCSHICWARSSSVSIPFFMRANKCMIFLTIFCKPFATIQINVCAHIHTIVLKIIIRDFTKLEMDNIQVFQTKPKTNINQILEFSWQTIELMKIRWFNK